MFILYYKYIDFEDPIKVCEDQIKLCEELNLKGRIRVSDEGINGTLNGELEHLSKYMHHVDLLYGPIHWKTGDYLPNKNKEDQMFKDLSVKVTKEVNLSAQINRILLVNQIIILNLYLKKTLKQGCQSRFKQVRNYSGEKCSWWCSFIPCRIS